MDLDALGALAEMIGALAFVFSIQTSKGDPFYSGREVRCATGSLGAPASSFTLGRRTT